MKRHPPHRLSLRLLLPSVALLLIGAVAVLPAKADDFAKRPKVQAFIHQMVSKHGFKAASLDKLFAGVQLNPGIIEAITRPAESLPWYKYRRIFVTFRRISGGVAFWKSHAGLLRKADKLYGVPPEIIVAVIGVETRYGLIKGGYSALDALSTLAFDYPPRSKFFTHELEQFLLLSREESLDPAKITSSYAGALGGPQFMPDSYRDYAVDFDKDGKRDLWNNWADIIGSVGNYFVRHGWQKDGLVAVPAAMPKGRTLNEVAAESAATAGKLRKLGLHFSAGINNNMPARLIVLDQPADKDYWVGLNNFWVITKYNRSQLYGMAVTQLSYAISQAYHSDPGKK